MQATVYSQYALKDLHQAIDLIDRKIQHCSTFEVFDSKEAKESMLQKLSTKRATLVKSAQTMSAQGVKSDPRFLPRSFIHPVEGAGEPVAAGDVARVEAMPKRRARRQQTAG